MAKSETSGRTMESRKSICFVWEHHHFWRYKMDMFIHVPWNCSRLSRRPEGRGKHRTYDPGNRCNTYFHSQIAWVSIFFHLHQLCFADCWSNAFLTGGGHPSGSDSAWAVSSDLLGKWSPAAYPPNLCQVRKCSDLPRMEKLKTTWSLRVAPIPTLYRIQVQLLRNAAVEVNILRPESAFGSSQRLDEDDHNFLSWLMLAPWTPLPSESESDSLTPHPRTSLKKWKSPPSLNKERLCMGVQLDGPLAKLPYK